MTSAAADAFARYERAISAHAGSAELFRGHDFLEFRAVAADLRACADSGDPRCQTALAGILGLGLVCESEGEYSARYAELIAEASQWWLRAADQSYWPAFDGLASCGVGPEADRAREICRLVETEEPSLVGRYAGKHGTLPVYGPRFAEEACRRWVEERRARGACS